jgi:hypothetical protein
MFLHQHGAAGYHLRRSARFGLSPMRQKYGQFMREQQTLRQKLMDHIGWFKTQVRRKP